MTRGSTRTCSSPRSSRFRDGTTVHSPTAKQSGLDLSPSVREERILTIHGIRAFTTRPNTSQDSPASYSISRFTKFRPRELNATLNPSTKILELEQDASPVDCSFNHMPNSHS